MTKEMIINATLPGNARVAFLKDGKLDNYFKETEDSTSTRGNIYIGKVCNVESSLGACFVDYGEDRHGFLAMDDIVSIYWPKKKSTKKRAKKIEEVIKRNQTIIVQVDKHPIGTKGARLTTNISLAGRFLVLTPYSEMLGISRKISNLDQRRKCREVASKLSPPSGMGLIIRTVGMDQKKRALARDLKHLVRLWKDIQSRSLSSKPPLLLHKDASIVQRVLRDYYADDVDQVWIDNEDSLKEAKDFTKFFIPRHTKKIKAYSDKLPIFSHFRIEEQIDEIYRRKVKLSSGGSIVIDQTEALVAIDVNSGKSKYDGGQEDTAREVNIEAANEIARQLRLRNLGGIVVIDFIDMNTQANRSAVEKSLKDAMRNDKSRHNIGKISSFGLCTLTRQRFDRPIQQLSYQECPTCSGDGMILAPDSFALRLLRQIQTELANKSVSDIRIRLHPVISNHLQNKYRSDILTMEKKFNVLINIEGTRGLSLSDQQIDLSLTPPPDERKKDKSESTPSHPIEPNKTPTKSKGKLTKRSTSATKKRRKTKKSSAYTKKNKTKRAPKMANRTSDNQDN
jgi:ribonuclease E